VASPIEQYLGQLRSKLESRFDSECADQLLSEIRSHLADAAEELEDEGVPRIEAEQLSVQRFGAPEKAAFLLPLGQQFGTGDKYWGWVAFGLAIAAALGLEWYAISATAQGYLSILEIRPILTGILVVYAYACWRAKSFSMLRQSAFVVAMIVMLTSLTRVDWTDKAVQGVTGLTSTRSLYVQRADSPLRQLGIPSISSSLLGDLGTPSGRPAHTGELAGGGPMSAELPQPKVPGMAPIGQNPWELTQEGFLPEVSQLLLSWLFLILMANAAVCWVGCLEHDQKNGVALLQ
jgi:hypothetical protein